MSTFDASYLNSMLLDTTAKSNSLVYQRDVSLPLNISLDTANNLGTLTTDETELNVKAQVMRENPTHFYKFTLDGSSIKMSFSNMTGSSGLRVQLLNSSGKIVADNSSTALEALQTAYKSMSSSSGLNQNAGDYSIKVTFDAAQLRSVPQQYSISLYSGTRFSTSYQTVAKAQTSERQSALVDDTMTFSLINAQAYETETAHAANETVLSAINIGWLYENKAALSVSSQLTDVCSAQYYSFTHQKGETLKLAFNNHTGTSKARVQLYDSSGTHLLADSHGTEDQQAAYAALSSSTGLDAPANPYVIKVSYVAGERETRQIYDFKVFSGTSYDSLYSTAVGTESAKNALANGHLTMNYSMKDSAVSYLMSMSQGDEISIMDTLSQTI
ncbi:MAG: hypothetical protein WC612_04410 [Bdellovibrionales bacterium]|jgi:hypothetical protein